MTSFPAATISDTEVRIFQSSFAPQAYQISVALPFHYHEKPEQTYPVIYVLDANLFFGMVVEMVRAMNIRFILQLAARCHHRRPRISGAWLFS